MSYKHGLFLGQNPSEAEIQDMVMTVDKVLFFFIDIVHPRTVTPLGIYRELMEINRVKIPHPVMVGVLIPFLKTNYIMSLIEFLYNCVFYLFEGS